MGGCVEEMGGIIEMRGCRDGNGSRDGRCSGRRSYLYNKDHFFIKVLIDFSNCKFTGKQRETVI